MTSRNLRLAAEPFRVALTGSRTVQVLQEIDPRPLGYYKIVEGDSLQSIAQRYYGDRWAAMSLVIQTANGLNSDSVLPVGVTIVIPDLGWRLR